MRFVIVLAIAFALVSAEVRPIDDIPISGSYAGPFGPKRDFASDFITGVPLGGRRTVVEKKVLNEPLIGQTITGHVLILSGVADAYHTYVAKDKCPGTAATSTTSAAHNCTIATNAGFFNMGDGSCIGPIVSDGKIVHSATRQGAVFGITTDGEYIAGYANESMIERGYFKQLVQGRGWLVRNGKSYLKESAEIENIAQSFIDLIAPRLAVGWDNQGRLILLIVDGVESKKLGLDLNTFTDMLIKLGCIEAVNLDGGGSVTFVWDGHICESSGVGQEKCEGNPTEFGPIPYYKPYERPVTSITCFKSN